MNLWTYELIVFGVLWIDWLIGQGLTSHQTHYRSYRGRGCALKLPELPGDARRVGGTSSRHRVRRLQNCVSFARVIYCICKPRHRRNRRGEGAGEQVPPNPSCRAKISSQFAHFAGLKSCCCTYIKCTRIYHFQAKELEKLSGKRLAPFPDYTRFNTPNLQMTPRWLAKILAAPMNCGAERVGRNAIWLGQDMHPTFSSICCRQRQQPGAYRPMPRRCCIPSWHPVFTAVGTEVLGRRRHTGYRYLQSIPRCLPLIICEQKWTRSARPCPKTYSVVQRVVVFALLIRYSPHALPSWTFGTFIQISRSSRF